MFKAYSVVILLASIYLCTTDTNHQFLLDFFTKKHCQSTVVYDCNSDASALPNRLMLARKLSANSLTSRFIDISTDQFENVSITLHPYIYAKTCCTVNFMCPGAEALLTEVSNYGYFNSTFVWLVIAPHNATMADELLWNVSGIQLNSDLTLAIATESTDHGSINLFDVHSLGRHICKDIYAYQYAQWSKELGIVGDPNYNVYRLRRNFNRLQLRGATVIDRENVTSNQVEELLEQAAKGTAPVERYHYTLMAVLRDFHNFTIIYRPVRGWAGRLPSGYRLGLLGVLKRHEVDVATSGIIMRRNRHAEVDTINYSWFFRTGFIFRVTPEISTKSGGNGFFLPFSLSVWLLFLLTLCLIAGLLKGLSLVHRHYLKGQEPHRASVAYLLDVVSGIAQQGVPMVSVFTPSRIVVAILLITNLVIYNYYTSAVVSGLLSTSIVGPETIDQIIDGPLKVSFSDAPYHHILLREQALVQTRRLYEKKVKPLRPPNALPIFTDPIQAVPYLKRGGHALHCELVEVYQAIANEFTANEICELRTVEGLYKYDVTLLALVLPKHSMYSEMFRLTMVHAREVGVVKRINHIHNIAKPICQGGATVYSVDITEVWLAFAILATGMLLSILIYMIEKREVQRRNIKCCFIK